MQAKLAVLGSLLLSLAACSPGPQPCMGVGSCPEGSECLANRCTLLGADPVASDTRRLVLTPTKMAVLSASAEASAELPPAVTFGSSSGGAALYLTFARAGARVHEIESAFLVLEPLSGTPRGPEDVKVEAWRIGADWTSDELSWLAQPVLRPPSASGIARSAPAMPLRLDVTEIAVYLAEHAQSDYGIAVRAGGGDDVGASFATGASGENAPRLELYVH